MFLVHIKMIEIKFDLITVFQNSPLLIEPTGPFSGEGTGATSDKQTENNFIIMQTLQIAVT